MRKIFSIQDKQYTKTGAQRELKRLLGQLRVATTEPPYRAYLTGGNFQFAHEAFLTHPRSHAKSNGGEPVTAIWVGPDSGNTGTNCKNWCYWVQTASGYTESFSVKSCFSRMDTHVNAQVNEALRGLVNEDMDEFRCQANPNMVTCEECNRQLYNLAILPDLKPAHVDHNVYQGKTFAAIKREFLAIHPNLEVERISIKGRPGWTLKDPDMQEEWVAFHRQRAVYRFLCHKCNSLSKNQ